MSKINKKVDQPLGVLFDVDGTLYHQSWLRLIIGSCILLKTLFHPIRTIREIRILIHYRRAMEWLRVNQNGDVTPELQIDRTALTTEVSPVEIKRCVNYWMEEAPLKLLPLCGYRKILRMIRRWHSFGVPLGVYSDYPAGGKLKLLGIKSLMSAVVCSTDPEVKAFKPHARGFEVAAKNLGLPPSKIIYIGDRHDVDAIGAYNAGMRFAKLDNSNNGFRLNKRNTLTLNSLDIALTKAYQGENGKKQRSQVNILDYIRLARPKHWFKNVFMLPGILLGWMASKPEDPVAALVSIGLGMLATCLVASSNYTINELLDVQGDQKHPDKKFRPVAAGRIAPFLGYIQWILLAVVGLGLARILNFPFFLTALSLFVMGIIYNVKPFRSKDRMYLDALSESINNPLRLLLGWYAVGCFLVPPVSLLLSYWMLGAFFMAVKRYAELRHINNKATAAAYRLSFKNYTPERLLISIVFYATAFGLFTGIFLIRYRIELILAIPFLAGLMAVYIHLGFLWNSPVQDPELLYKRRDFVAYGLLTALVLITCLLIRVPWLSRFFETTIPTGF